MRRKSPLQQRSHLVLSQSPRALALGDIPVLKRNSSFTAFRPFLSPASSPISMLGN
jgi:hypothetical protein